MPLILDAVTHQNLLRAMDALVDNAVAVEEALACQFRPLVDQVLSVVFYDLTTERNHGECRVEDDIRAQGMNKETGVDRQFVLGVVQIADGLPLMPPSIPVMSERRRYCRVVCRRFSPAFKKQHKWNKKGNIVRFVNHPG